VPSQLADPHRVGKRRRRYKTSTRYLEELEDLGLMMVKFSTETGQRFLTCVVLVRPRDLLEFINVIEKSPYRKNVDVPLFF